MSTVNACEFAVMREQKARVKLCGLQGGQKYTEFFTVSALCTDGATHKVADYARTHLRSVKNVKVDFVDWLGINDPSPVNP